MALIPCPECGKDISENALSCPSCGLPVIVLGEKKSRYKAAIFAIILGAFGAHKFYLNNRLWGMVYLLFFWTGIPAIVGFFEGVIYLLTSDTRFQERFVTSQKPTMDH
jgi:TM2 domain-containing membrane protein YozV